MKVLVVGATGGSGKATVQELLAAGHQVTAFARNANRIPLQPNLRLQDGDALKPADLERAVEGQDAVIVTLGITENPLRVRLLGSAGTAMDVRSAGTRHVIQAMQRHNVRKLLVQTTFGIGETRDKLPLVYRLMFGLLLKPQIADSVKQEQFVRASGLDWVLVQPVNLTDAAEAGPAFASTTGQTRTMKVSRQRVGRFLAQAVTSNDYTGQSVALSS